ncbi:cholinesterase 1-like [Ptychodera flava]|uniref:cholinesterase 1-like n=1 Tax=Ptychodera flava TaxID=63121 RepID=UPI00396A4DD5
MAASARVLAFVGLFSIAVGDEIPRVEIRTGTVIGEAVEFRHEPNRTIHVYKGIPFAEPPIGELRFREPVPRAEETDQSLSVISVTDPIDEDCLYLNVYAPQGRAEPAAVMVWFHGGGLISGSASMAYYDGVPLAAIGDVIIITVNYRLGALGFLYTGDDMAPGNAGLYDQRLALMWVQDNIEAFGGDPNRVTLFGFSAGASSVGFHLISPLSSGLFHRGIIQSGSPSSSWLTISDQQIARNRAFALGKILNCESESTEELVSCLRKVPAEKFIVPGTQMYMISPITGESTTTFPFYATVDGRFIPENVNKMLKDHSFNKLKVMMGFAKDEGTFMPFLFMPQMRNETELFVDRANFDSIFDATVSQVKGKPILKELIEYQYSDKVEFDSHVNYADLLNEIMTDLSASCAVLDVTHAYASAEQRVYLYHYTHQPSRSIYDIAWMKAAHGELQQYLFGFHLMEGWDWNITDEEAEMSLRIMKYWTNFAKTGDPNTSEDGENVTAADGNEYWPPYSKLNLRYKTLNPEMPNGQSLKERECVFWNDLLPGLVDYTDYAADHEKEKYSEKLNKPMP